MKAIDALRGKGLTRDFARLLVTELGADAKPIKDDWCWKNMLKRYDKIVPAVITWFCRALTDKDFFVRRSAAAALGEIGDAEAVPALILALADEDAMVRWLAAVALGQIGDPRAVPSLRQALKDEDSEVRWYAAEALGEIGDVKDVPALTLALMKEEKS